MAKIRVSDGGQVLARQWPWKRQTRRSQGTTQIGKRVLQDSPLSIQPRKIVGHKAALDRKHGARRNPFGCVVMSPMQQICRPDSEPKTESRSRRLARHATS